MGEPLDPEVQKFKWGLEDDPEHPGLYKRIGPDSDERFVLGPDNDFYPANARDEQARAMPPERGKSEVFFAPYSYGEALRYWYNQLDQNDLTDYPPKLPLPPTLRGLQILPLNETGLDVAAATWPVTIGRRRTNLPPEVLERLTPRWREAASRIPMFEVFLKDTPPGQRTESAEDYDGLFVNGKSPYILLYPHDPNDPEWDEKVAAHELTHALDFMSSPQEREDVRQGWVRYMKSRYSPDEIEQMLQQAVSDPDNHIPRETSAWLGSDFALGYPESAFYDRAMTDHYGKMFSPAITSSNPDRFVPSPDVVAAFKRMATAGGSSVSSSDPNSPVNYGRYLQEQLKLGNVTQAQAEERLLSFMGIAPDHSGNGAKAAWNSVVQYANDLAAKVERGDVSPEQADERLRIFANAEDTTTSSGSGPNLTTGDRGHYTMYQEPPSANSAIAGQADEAQFTAADPDAPNTETLPIDIDFRDPTIQRLFLRTLVDQGRATQEQADERWRRFLSDTANPYLSDGMDAATDEEWQPGSDYSGMAGSLSGEDETPIDLNGDGTDDAGQFADSSGWTNRREDPWVAELRQRFQPGAGQQWAEAFGRAHADPWTDIWTLPGERRHERPWNSFLDERDDWDVYARLQAALGRTLKPGWDAGMPSDESQNYVDSVRNDLLDQAWSRKFEATYGHGPSEDDWQYHYYNPDKDVAAYL